MCSDNFIVNTRSIQCKYCQSQFHSHCVKQKDSIQKALQESSSLFWFCNRCMPVVLEKLSNLVVGSPSNSQQDSTATTPACKGGSRVQRAEIEKIVSCIVGPRFAELHAEHTSMSEEFQAYSTGLKREIQILRESNVDLVRLLTSGGGAVDPRQPLREDALGMSVPQKQMFVANDGVAGASDVRSRARSQPGGRPTESFGTAVQSVVGDVEMVRPTVTGYSTKTATQRKKRRGGVDQQNDGTSSAPSSRISNFNFESNSQAAYAAESNDAVADKYVGAGQRRVDSRDRFISKNKARLSGAKAKLRPIERSTWIYLANLAAETTTEDILNVLREIDEDANFDVEKRLSTGGKSCSFVMKAPARYESLLRDANFWPADVYVNRYYFPKSQHRNFPNDLKEPDNP